MPQVAEDFFSKGLLGNVCNLFGGINWVHGICSITNKTPKVMILDDNMICTWSKIWALCNSDTDLISSQTVQKNTGYLVISPNKPAASFIRLINGINALIVVDRAMYPISLVLSEIYFWIFLPQWIVHAAYMITKTVRDNSYYGESWSSSFHPPAKSAST